MTNDSLEISLTSSDCESAGYVRLIELEHAKIKYSVYLHYNDWDGYRSDWMDEEGESIEEPEWAPREYELDGLAIEWEVKSTNIYADISPAKLFEYLTLTRFN